jgi:hypothetical protein
MVWPRS